MESTEDYYSFFERFGFRRTPMMTESNIILVDRHGDPFTVRRPETLSIEDRTYHARRFILDKGYDLPDEKAG